MEAKAPSLVGVPFSDDYRDKGWLLTVPLLLIEVFLVMKFLLMGDNSARVVYNTLSFALARMMATTM